MDRKTMLDQLRILRSKSSTKKPTIQNNVIKFNEPIPKKSSDIILNSNSIAHNRRLKAEAILAQRQYIHEIKKEKTIQQVIPLTPNTQNPRKCGACNRKK